MQRSQAWLAQLGREPGINPRTVAKWRKRATVEDRKTGQKERSCHDDHDRLRSHLADFPAADTFARSPKTLGGITPYEYTCKTRTSEPEPFILDPIHQVPGLNS